MSRTHALIGAILSCVLAVSARGSETGTDTGACCLEDDVCQVLTLANCLAAGGVYQGDDVPCPPGGLCETITGGCCLPTGECFSLTLVQCIAQGGSADAWHPGVDCGNACPGACCLPGLACVELGQVDCEAQAGFFQGNGTLCGTTTCLPFGACCLPAGDCVVEFMTDCDALGGQYQGDGTSCDTVLCSAFPVACCLPSGQCVLLSPTDCIAAGGSPQGIGSSCAGTVCPQPLIACCFPSGACSALTADDCSTAGGTPQAFPSDCGSAPCPQPTVACCFPSGACDALIADDCIAAGGSPQAFPSDCGSTVCPQPTVACCLPSGACAALTVDACVAAGGSPQAFPSDCGSTVCPQPAVACCFPSGACDTLTAEDCAAAGGSAQAFPSDCATVNCPQPTGACCFPNGTCQERTAAQCASQGGTFQGNFTTCFPGLCPPPTPAPPARNSYSEKGSLLVYSKVEVRFDQQGNVLADTFISLTNDYPSDVRVLMYFINGDEPLPETPTDRAHPGWNFVDNEISLTRDQPAVWSSATGLGTVNVSPWPVLDPGMPPGRFDPDQGNWMIRGMIYAWAVDADGHEIHWNHLSGVATTVFYDLGAAREAGAAAFQSVQPLPLGAKTGTPGVLNLDNIEYAQAPSQLLYNFQAWGSTAWSTAEVLAVPFPALALHPVSVDLRDAPDNPGPITTRATFDIWNENEVKFSGTYRCVTCFDCTLLSNYDVPNHFFVGNLQSDHGKARIDGLSGAPCVDAVSAAMLGVSLRLIAFEGVPYEAGSQFGPPPVDTRWDATASPLVGIGFEAAIIRFDVINAPPPEAPGAAPGRTDAGAGDDDAMPGPRRGNDLPAAPGRPARR
ncbi:MAG: hypothetical protein KF817_16040 [Phycisphaeraceae bacterium]|nr:hypothetical protein [Phycisphaeraceae bacterium]